VDNGISEMLNSVLSNPDSLNKIMNLMPVVAQMMGSGGAEAGSGEKIVETTAVPVIPAIAPPAQPESPDIMANAEVMNALKNLVAALSSASPESASAPASVPAFASAPAPETPAASPAPAAIPAMAADTARIEKTLDTLKNFSSATSPENDHRSKLLLALKPFMKDDRKTKIDTAIKYINAAKILNLFGKNGFV